MMIGLLCLPAIADMHAGDDESRKDGRTQIRALAPFEIVASGFEALAGVAAEPGGAVPGPAVPAGAVLVTDREAGTLIRLGASGRRRVLLRGLLGPTDVAIDGAGAVLVLEEGGRRLLRLTPEGVVTVAASTLKQARAVTIGPGGQIWVSMRRTAGRDGDDEWVIARLDEFGTPTTLVTGFIDVRGLTADASSVYVVMRRLAGERGRVRTILARIPVQPDGRAGAIEPLMLSASDRLEGVAVDTAGAVFVTDSEGVILKRERDGSVRTFATGLRRPVAVAFAPNGDLAVVEEDDRGRVLRFLAPSPPTMTAPAFTNQSPLRLQGQAVARARITVTRPESPLTAVAAAASEAVSGAFAVQVPLDANATNTLRVAATAAMGAGLTSRPLTTEIVHDALPPSLMMIEPVAGMHTRRPILSSAEATDEGSGVATVLWSVDGIGMAHLENPVPGDPFIATTVLAVEGFNDGPHALDVVATDRAGNQRVARVPFVIDRTPPEMLIVSGPPAAIAARTATFSVSGTDAWSTVGQLDYAWRLDEGPWSAFDALAAITLVDLAPGEHRFEVRARDRAGNEDATPASQTFTVRSLRIRILEPAAGAVVTGGSLWVRAIVEGGAGEVSVRVPLPASFGAGELIAPVQGDSVAIEVPVDPALTIVTLIATDEAGDTAQANVSIVVAGARAFEPGLELWPPGGVAPLTVRLGLRGWIGSHVTVDVDGDGINEFDGQLDTDDLSTTYARAGVYVPAVRITTPEGEELTRRGAVEVYDGAVLDARLQTVWTGFKDALRGADVPAAVGFIAAERRAAWTEYFSALPPDALADVDRVFTAMTLVEVGYGGAQYEMVAERDGLLYSYAIWFRIDSDGRWRLWRF